MKMTSPRVTSSQASTRTVRERARRIGGMWGVVSGGDSALQPSREAGGQTADDRKKLLDELLKLPGNFKAQVSLYESLALKSDLQIPWTKMRAMRR